MLMIYYLLLNLCFKSFKNIFLFIIFILVKNLLLFKKYLYFSFRDMSDKKNIKYNDCNLFSTPNRFFIKIKFHPGG